MSNIKDRMEEELEQNKMLKKMIIERDDEEIYLIL